MLKPCSLDLRIRLLEAVIAEASRREAADCFDVSASSAVKWLQLWQETVSVAAKPPGGSISPLEEHADWLVALISKQSDLSDAGYVGAVWRAL
jgi:transposase